MRGIGFWEPPTYVHDSIEKGHFLVLTDCLSSFIIARSDVDLSDFQLTHIFGMGKPELMAQRVEQEYKSLVRKEDITNIEWDETDATHATGSFDLDGFYAHGHLIFEAIKINGEWVISYLAIPRKKSSDKTDPFVALSIDKYWLNKYTKKPRPDYIKKKKIVKIPEPNEADLALKKKLTGEWEGTNQIYIVTLLSENGDFQEQAYKTKQKKELYVTAKGKWWVANDHYYYHITETKPEMQVSPDPYSFKIESVNDAELTLIGSSGGKEIKIRIQ